MEQSGDGTCVDEELDVISVGSKDGVEDNDEVDKDGKSDA